MYWILNLILKFTARLVGRCKICSCQHFHIYIHLSLISLYVQFNDKRWREGGTHHSSPGHLFLISPLQTPTQHTCSSEFYRRISSDAWKLFLLFISKKILLLFHAILSFPDLLLLLLVTFVLAQFLIQVMIWKMNGLLLLITINSFFIKQFQCMLGLAFP